MQDQTIAMAHGGSRGECKRAGDTGGRVDAPLSIYPPLDRMAGIVGVIQNGDTRAYFAVLQRHVQIDPACWLLFGFVPLLPGRIEDGGAHIPPERHADKESTIGMLLDLNVGDGLHRPI